MNNPLFDEARHFLPLAARMRPKTLGDYIGQEHILAPGCLLYEAISSGVLHSLLLWGPPGVGKTSLAQLMAEQSQAQFIQLSAVLAGVKDIRAAIEQAQLHRLQYGKQTILFVDEVHRFNKAQQDVFLPHIENGDIIFIGATTENPSFELNAALLSRLRVYILNSLSQTHLSQLLDKALSHDTQLAQTAWQVDEAAKNLLLQACDGDARRLLNLLELACDMASDAQIHLDTAKQVISQSLRRFDKGGDVFYEQISALHKSIRGSSPDAALYWLCRMLDGGCDALYIARRMIRVASEDIGTADPRALTLAMSAWDALERLGSPEGELALAHCVVYLAVAAKSNAVYKAYNQMRQLIQTTGSLPVPLHLRNAPSKLMQSLDYGKEYRYAHDEDHAFAAGENYFPESLAKTRLYYPSDRGLEKKIQEKLVWLEQLNQQSESQRYP